MSRAKWVPDEKIQVYVVDVWNMDIKKVNARKDTEKGTYKTPRGRWISTCYENFEDAIKYLRKQLEQDVKECQDGIDYAQEIMDNAIKEMGNTQRDFLVINDLENRHAKGTL